MRSWKAPSGREQVAHRPQEPAIDRVAPDMPAAFDLLATQRPDAVDADATGKDPVIEQLIAREIRNGAGIERYDIRMVADRQASGRPQCCAAA